MALYQRSLIINANLQRAMELQSRFQSMQKHVYKELNQTANKLSKVAIESRDLHCPKTDFFSRLFSYICMNVIMILSIVWKVLYIFLVILGLAY